MLDAPHIPKDKDVIIDKHLPFINRENRIYIPYDAKKTDYIQITSCDYVLDDLTTNLVEVEESGGHGIKLLNGINANKRTWKGPAVHKDYPYTLIVEQLEIYMNLKEKENEMEKV